jgi:hypothetical protein
MKNEGQALYSSFFIFHFAFFIVERFSHTSTHAVIAPVVAMLPNARSTSPTPS